VILEWVLATFFLNLDKDVPIDDIGKSETKEKVFIEFRSGLDSE